MDFRTRTPDDAEVAAAAAVATVASQEPLYEPNSRNVAQAAATQGLMATHVEWWLSDSKWWDVDRRPPRAAWALSPLDDLSTVIAWLVPQADRQRLLLPECATARAEARGAYHVRGSLTGDRFAQVFGVKRGLTTRDARQRLAQWLLQQDHAAMQRRSRVPGAEELARKAQGLRFLTMFGEAGDAYELYPVGQVQRRNVDGHDLVRGASA
jgi:hypothetical protein